MHKVVAISHYVEPLTWEELNPEVITNEIEQLDLTVRDLAA